MNKFLAKKVAPSHFALSRDGVEFGDLKLIPQTVFSIEGDFVQAFWKYLPTNGDHHLSDVINEGIGDSRDLTSILSHVRDCVLWLESEREAA